MKNDTSQYRCVVGIDVAKDKLDFDTQQQTLPGIVANDPTALESALLKRVAQFKDALFVVEATGGYERKVVDWCKRSAELFAG